MTGRNAFLILAGVSDRSHFLVELLGILAGLLWLLIRGNVHSHLRDLWKAVAALILLACLYHSLDVAWCEIWSRDWLASLLANSWYRCIAYAALNVVIVAVAAFPGARILHWITRSKYLDGCAAAALCGTIPVLFDLLRSAMPWNPYLQ